MSHQENLTTDRDDLQTPQRRRNAEDTKKIILEAARIVFMEKGYDGASTRDIAKAADSNVSLINRYFGSKRGLFEAAILPTLEVEKVLDGDMAHFGERITRHFVHKSLKDEFDPMVALIRAAASEEVNGAARQTFSDKFVKPIAMRLGGERTTERAAMIAIILAGIDLTARVLEIPMPSAGDLSQMESYFAKAVQDIVDSA